MIDERADIHPRAKIADNVTIGPWTLIGPDVEIGENCIIESHVVIKGPTRMGCNNHIYQFSSIGEAPQDKKFANEDTVLEIGNDNTIREYVTLNRGTVQGGGVTKIGNDNWIMAYVHVAHDCIIADHTIFSNNASLAGHVNVEDYAIIGGFSGVHQFCTIGAHSFVGKACYLTKDVLPFMMAAGHAAKIYGLNSEGLKRRGFSDDTLQHLRTAYKIIYRQGLTVKDAVFGLEALLPQCPEVQILMDALQNSQRGIAR